MAFIEFEIPVRSWSTEEREIVMAKMSLLGFEGFIEGEDIIQAYIDESFYSGDAINLLRDELAASGISLQYRFHRKEEQNWNREWEKKFQPVVIGDRVLIRAPFHDGTGDLPCTLIIEPKMSFGTGHHHTTRLMIREMMEMDFKGKRVLDMGCGTGVLGIYASKMGASRVIGVDIDQWAYENALENVERNRCSIEIRLGDIKALGGEQFDVILANITRNILVRDLQDYCNHLDGGGYLLVSGFLAEDVQYIFNAAYRCRMDHLHTLEDENWIALSFRKPLGSKVK
jgi:ribosomal protein L11 methyltransferase